MERSKRQFDQPILRSTDDPFGIDRDPMFRAKMSGRRLRRWTHSRSWMFHRPKNGIYDPITYAIVIEVLLRIVPGNYWTAAQLVESLREREDRIVWDAVTVGRILADIYESGDDRFGKIDRPLEHTRDSRGRFYSTTPSPEGRGWLAQIRDDLEPLAEKVTLQELLGDPIRRFESPLIVLAR